MNRHYLAASAARRRRQVKILDEVGLTPQEISAKLGVTPRTVQRDRAALGLIEYEPWDGWNEQTETLALNLLTDECPYTEVARTLGCTKWAVMNKFPGYGRIGNPLGNGHYMRLAIELGLALSTCNPPEPITA